MANNVFENQKEWIGVSLKNDSGDASSATVQRDLKGKTGWSLVGSGDTKTLEFNFQMELEQLDGADLPV